MTKGIQSWKHLSLSKSLPCAKEKWFHLGWNFVFIIASEKSSFDVVAMFIPTDTANAGDVGLQKILCYWLGFSFSSRAPCFMRYLGNKAALNAVDSQKWASLFKLLFSSTRAAMTRDCQFPSLSKNGFYSSLHRSIWTWVGLWSSIHPATLTRGARVPRGTTLCSPRTRCLTNLVSPSTSTSTGGWKHERSNTEARAPSYLQHAKQMLSSRTFVFLLVHRKYGIKKRRKRKKKENQLGGKQWERT